MALVFDRLVISQNKNHDICLGSDVKSCLNTICFVTVHFDALLRRSATASVGSCNALCNGANAMIVAREAFLISSVIRQQARPGDTLRPYHGNFAASFERQRQPSLHTANAIILQQDQTLER